MIFSVNVHLQRYFELWLRFWCAPIRTYELRVSSVTAESVGYCRNYTSCQMLKNGVFGWNMISLDRVTSLEYGRLAAQQKPLYRLQLSARKFSGTFAFNGDSEWHEAGDSRTRADAIFNAPFWIRGTRTNYSNQVCHTYHRALRLIMSLKLILDCNM